MLTVVIFHSRAPCQDPALNRNATSHFLQPFSPARMVYQSACTPVWDICLQNKSFSNKLYCFNHYDKQSHSNCNSDKMHKCLNKHHLYVLGLLCLICIRNICSSAVKSVLMMNKTYDVISRSRWITVIYRYSSEWHSEGLKMSRYAAVRSGNHTVSHNLSVSVTHKHMYTSVSIVWGLTDRFLRIIVLQGDRDTVCVLCGDRKRKWGGSLGDRDAIRPLRSLWVSALQWLQLTKLERPQKIFCGKLSITCDV